MRNSNIELCRIISMVMVILLHSSYSANGWPHELNSITAGLSFIECFSIIAVNVFVLITGYFSTSLKKKSLFNFLFIVVFYGILKVCYQLITGCFKYSSLLIITNQNWFVLCYLCLVLLSPIINEYIKHSNKKQLIIQIILLFSLSTVTDFIPGIGGIFNKGCSPLSFINIYLLGRYIYIYGCNKLFVRYSWIIYIFSSLLLFIGCIVILYYRLPQIVLFHWLYYSNPIIVVGALSFFLMFEKMKAKNNKIINHIALSCLAVLLLHVPHTAPMWSSMKSFYQLILSEWNNVFMISMLWIVGVLVIFISSIVIDQIRIVLWRSFEKQINKVAL